MVHTLSLSKLQSTGFDRIKEAFESNLLHFVESKCNWHSLSVASLKPLKRRSAPEILATPKKPTKPR